MAGLAIPLVLSGISALGGLLGNRPQTSTSSSTGSSSSSSSGSTQPVYDPANLNMRDTLLDYYRRQLDDDTDLSGYKAQGISTINQSADARKLAISNSLTSRGLAYSPVAATAPAMVDQGRISDTNSLINSIPLLAAQLKSQRLNDAAGFEKSLPVGSTTNMQQNGQQSSNQTGTTPGNMAGGALTSGATTLAGLYGKIYAGKGF